MPLFSRYVIHHHISDEDFPGYYKAMDAFVLPSRGEGWGRPHVEAMSMALVSCMYGYSMLILSSMLAWYVERISWHE